MPLVSHAYNKLKCILECISYVSILFVAYLSIVVILPYKSINPNFFVCISMILAMLIYAKAFKSFNNEIREKINFNNLNLILTLYIFLSALIFNIICTSIILQLSSLEIIKNYINSTSNTIYFGNIAFNIFIIAIITPIFEEFLFRGYIQTNLSKQFNIRTALILQALMYSLLHWDIVQSTYTFFLGIVLGLLMNKYKTLLVPMLFHVAFNGSNLLINTLFQKTKFSAYQGGLVFLITTISVVVILYFNKSKNNIQKPTNDLLFLNQ